MIKKWLQNIWAELVFLDLKWRYPSIIHVLRRWGNMHGFKKLILRQHHLYDWQMVLEADVKVDGHWIPHQIIGMTSFGLPFEAMSSLLGQIMRKENVDSLEELEIICDLIGEDKHGN